MKRNSWRAIALSLSVGLLGLAGCYTVPETGRSSFILPLGDDVAQGAAAFAEIKVKEKVSTNQKDIERVRRIGTRIATAVGNALPGAQWEFVVFEAPDTVNAFALPGGKVGVYSGLINVAGSDDELAIVMGHEIGHVTARHGAERMTQAAVASAVGAAVDAGTKDSKAHDLLLAGYGAGATGVVLKFSRDNESEADYIGIRYAAKAGYDPRAAVTFWQKMAKGKIEQTGVIGVLGNLASTHPVDSKRIADLQAHMSEVLPIYEEAKKKYQ